MASRVMRNARRTRIRLAVLAGVAVMGLAACSSSGGSGSSSASAPTKTLKVAFSSYMPYSGVTAGGQITGLDGDIISAVAAKLGYSVQPDVMDFSGVLAAVQSGRADVAVGDIFWSKARAETGLFTDPPYYSGFVVIQQPSSEIGSIAALSGKTIGDDVGSAYIDAEKEIPGATLKIYSTSAEVLQALQDGQIDAYLGSPLIAEYTSKADPSVKLHEVAMAAPTSSQLAQHPAFEALEPAQTGFFLAKGNTKLLDEINATLRTFYADGKLAAIVKEWGGNPTEFLTPTAGMAALRIGVDRSKGWAEPSISN